MLKKHYSGEWIEDCQNTFDKVKDYLSTPSILVPPILWKPLILYLIVHEKSIGCVLGQHDESGKKKHAIYYLSKKFTVQVLLSGKDVLCTSLDHSKTQAILAIPYYSGTQYAAQARPAQASQHRPRPDPTSPGSIRPSPAQLSRKVSCFSSYASFSSRGNLFSLREHVNV